MSSSRLIQSRFVCVLMNTSHAWAQVPPKGVPKAMGLCSAIQRTCRSKGHSDNPLKDTQGHSRML